MITVHNMFRFVVVLVYIFLAVTGSFFESLEYCSSYTDIMRKVSTRKISTRKISTRKISTRKISTRKISTRKISTRKISTREISTVRELY